MNQLVTVIITTYNSVNTIESAIKSVLNQSYNNVEIIVYDDCSNDLTCEVANRVLQNDGIEYVVKSGNVNFGGPARGRNWGCSKAKGEYVCFLDADDTWNKNKIKEQLDVMIARDLSISSTNASVIGGEQFPVISGYISIAKMIRRNQLILSSVMIKKSILNDLHYVFNEEISFISVEDYDLFLRLMILKNKVFVIHGKLINYFVLENSISHKNVGENELKRLYVLKKLRVNNVFHFLWKSIIITSYKLKYICLIY